jgi:hydroxymethylpyrimidine pyrophosphatase-like HAD family hydrolase
MNSTNFNASTSSTQYELESDLLLCVSESGALPHLEQITHVYTDLDGTLFAPGGKLLANHAGEASTESAEALVALKRAGIEVIIVTGRNGAQGHEMLRILNLQTFIGELGCMTMEGFGVNARISYELGDWAHTVLDEGLAPGELPDGMTPYRFMVANGVVERLLATFPGKLEPHVPYPDERKVTHAFRGFVDAEAAAAFLDSEQLPLELADNGQIHPQVHTLVDCPEIHIYHLVPRGTSKALTVAADAARRGLNREQTLAIGDAIGDLEMGEYTGTLVIMGNALKSPIMRKAIEKRADTGAVTLYTKGSTADGWVEFARALLAAKTGSGAGASPIDGSVTQS